MINRKIRSEKVKEAEQDIKQYLDCTHLEQLKKLYLELIAIDLESGRCTKEQFGRIDAIKQESKKLYQEFLEEFTWDEKGKIVPLVEEPVLCEEIRFPQIKSEQTKSEQLETTQLRYDGVDYNWDKNSGSWVSATGKNLASARRTNWKQIGLGILGALLGAGASGSYRQEYEPEYSDDINRPINLGHTSPLAIQGCVLEEDASGHIFLRYKCQYCGWVSNKQFEVHRARYGGETGGVFNCGNRCPQQSYKILHS